MSGRFVLFFRQETPVCQELFQDLKRFPVFVMQQLAVQNLDEFIHQLKTRGQPKPQWLTGVPLLYDNQTQRVFGGKAKILEFVQNELLPSAVAQQTAMQQPQQSQPQYQYPAQQGPAPITAGPAGMPFPSQAQAQAQLQAQAQAQAQQIVYDQFQQQQMPQPQYPNGGGAIPQQGIMPPYGGAMPQYQMPQTPQQPTSVFPPQTMPQTMYAQPHMMQQQLSQAQFAQQQQQQQYPPQLQMQTQTAQTHATQSGIPAFILNEMNMKNQNGGMNAGATGGKTPGSKEFEYCDIGIGRKNLGVSIIETSASSSGKNFSEFLSDKKSTGGGGGGGSMSAMQQQQQMAAPPVNLNTMSDAQIQQMLNAQYGGLQQQQPQAQPSMYGGGGGNPMMYAPQMPSQYAPSNGASGMMYPPSR